MRWTAAFGRAALTSPASPPWRGGWPGFSTAAPPRPGSWREAGRYTDPDLRHLPPDQDPHRQHPAVRLPAGGGGSCPGAGRPGGHPVPAGGEAVLSDPGPGESIPAGDGDHYHRAGAPAGGAAAGGGALAQARPQAEAKGLTLAAEPCGAAARFDRKWTAEALFNVVDNAVKYTPAGGTGDPLRRPLGQFCRVDVSGHRHRHPRGGAGADLRPLLPGRRCAGGGGGGHRPLPGPGDPAAAGGYVKVASRPGQGTTFSLYLPRE